MIDKNIPILIKDRIVSIDEMDNYYISSSGIVYSRKNKGRGSSRNILKPMKGVLCKRTGYLAVVFTKGRSVWKRISIHKLVASYFIKKHGNGWCVNHKNSIRTDNRVENLEVITTRDNVIHGIKHGKMKSKLVQKDVLNIFELVKSYSQSDIAKIYNVSESAVSSVLRKRNWRWLTNEK